MKTISAINDWPLEKWENCTKFFSFWFDIFDLKKIDKNKKRKTKKLNQLVNTINWPINLSTTTNTNTHSPDIFIIFLHQILNWKSIREKLEKSWMNEWKVFFCHKICSNIGFNHLTDRIKSISITLTQHPPC